jgi:hypothetical protein
MGFFNKIKQVLGIGTVKVEIDVEPTFCKSGDTISGKLLLTAKSEQNILELEVKLEETWTKGRGDDKTVKTFDLGEWKDTNSFDMKAGDVKEVPFTLSYSISKSKNDRLSESGGKVGKALGGLGKMMDAETSAYKLIATCDVKGAAFDPNSITDMKLVD